MVGVFPKAVEPQTYDMGAAVHIMTKDIGIYHEELAAAGLPKAVGDAVYKIWEDANQEMPTADFSRIFEFIRDRGEG